MDSQSLSVHRSYTSSAQLRSKVHFPGNRIMALGVFLFVLITHFQFPINQTFGDAVWNLPTAFSLVYEGNTDLSEYKKLIDQVGLGYTVQYINNTPYNTYPVGPSLVAVPFVAALQWISNNLLFIDLHALSEQNILFGLDKFIACVMVAGAAAFIYLIARFYLSNLRSLLITCIFAFCTSALSVASRALWQHGPSMLMLSITLYALLRAQHSPTFLILAGFTLAFAYIIRPANAISVSVLTIYVLLRYRQKIILLLVGAALVSLPFFYLNATLYGQPLAPYFVAYFLPVSSVGDLIQGLLGTLISPNRGLFVFSPVLLFSVLGVGLKLRSRAMTGLEYALLLIIILHWLLMSSYHNWWAGFSFGPRYMSDILPYLAFFLIPFLVNLPTFSRIKFYLAMTFLVLTTFVSLAINFRGASSVDTQTWNHIPVSVDDFPARVWDWSDLQFLRGLSEPVGSIALGSVSAHRFEFDTDTQTFEGDGWGDAETAPDGTTFQWTNQKQASISIRLVSDHDLQVQMRVERAIAPDILKTFAFTVNNHPIVLSAVNDIYSGVIPASVLSANGQPSELRFTVDQVVSPQSLGQGSDTRTLGLLIDYLDIHP